MRRSCDLCNKGTRIGRNRSHAQNRTRRTFKTNVQKVTMSLEGDKISGNFCTRCIKKLKQEVAAAKTVLVK